MPRFEPRVLSLPPPAWPLPLLQRRLCMCCRLDGCGRVPPPRPPFRGPLSSPGLSPPLPLPLPLPLHTHPFSQERNVSPPRENPGRQQLGRFSTKQRRPRSPGGRRFFLMSQKPPLSPVPTQDQEEGRDPLATLNSQAENDAHSDASQSPGSPPSARPRCPSTVLRPARHSGCF